MLVQRAGVTQLEVAQVELAIKEKELAIRQAELALLDPEVHKRNIASMELKLKLRLQDRATEEHKKRRL